MNERLAAWQNRYNAIRDEYFAARIGDHNLRILLNRECRYRDDALEAEVRHLRKQRARLLSDEAVA